MEADECIPVTSALIVEQEGKVLVTIDLMIVFFSTLITCVIARSNPRRLLPFWREKLRGHYHVTMTFDNDFCV